MPYSEKYFASGWQSLKSEHVRQNIIYIGSRSSGSFREASMATNSSHAYALDLVTSHYFCGGNKPLTES